MIVVPEDVRAWLRSTFRQRVRLLSGVTSMRGPVDGAGQHIPQPIRAGSIGEVVELRFSKDGALRLRVGFQNGDAVVAPADVEPVEPMTADRYDHRPGCDQTTPLAVSTCKCAA